MLRALLCIMVLLCASPVIAQEIHHHPGESSAVDEYYSTWFIPPMRKTSCCNRIDCYATAMKRVGEVWFVLRREDQAWIPVPDNIIEQNQSDPRDSPDGRAHVCLGAPPHGQLYCVTLGSGM